MKYLLIVLFIVSPYLYVAKGQSKEECSYTYFTNKKKSTSQCWDENRYSGKAIAYNQKGEVIGEWTLSRMHMLSSVQFTFHENGGVKMARYSSHPDAGIQQYHSTTTFDENGTKIDFYEEDFDGHHRVPNVIYKQDETEQKRNAEKLKREADSLLKIANEKKNTETKKDTLKQEVIECAVIYVSELWIDNRSGKDIIIKYEKKYKDGSKENSPASLKIKKGEKIKITEQIQAQFYDDPMNYYLVTVWDKKGKKKMENKLSKTFLTDESRIKENKKGYIYEVK